MAGQTPLLGLAFFDYLDQLDSTINVRKEIDRFMLIDKQLYGMYLIFGNGVIDGWDISAGPAASDGTISVSITSGDGIINFLASSTSTSVVLTGLAANSQFFIYATTDGATITDRTVRFAATRGDPGGGAILLAIVTTNSTGISLIDVSSKQNISFLSLIKSEIANHHHTGAIGSPTKIDLQTETRNQLPGARIADLDASQISTGRFPIDRIPQLDHNNLENAGILTHAALDSFARTLTEGNRQLLGEVTAVNNIKQLIFAAYENPISIEHTVNFLPIIPGITPNSYIDFDNTTAQVNISEGCISGLPVKSGQINSIIWNTTAAFATNFDSKEVLIADNTVSLARGGGTDSPIENFEGVSGNNVPVPNFSVSTSVIADSLTVISDNSNSLHTEGFFGGKFNTGRTYRALYQKIITTNKDWSLFDEIILDIKCLSLTHGPVYMYFINGTGSSVVQSQVYLLLGQDEVTTSADPSANGFKKVFLPISNETRTDVTQIVFYTDDLKTSFIFWMDNILLRNQSLFSPTGFIKFRYSGGVNVTFNSIIYDAIVPDGTRLFVRARSAGSPSLLSRASFTPYLNPGDVISLTGTDAEIEIDFISNIERTATPILNSVELQVVTTADFNGFSISEATDWDKGTYINTSRTNNDFSILSSLNISPIVPVGDIYYSRSNVINEIDLSGNAVYGISGLFSNTMNNYFLSPKQALNFANSGGQFGFRMPFSVYRLQNRNFIVADTDNDRVIETTPDGVFVRGIGSQNISDPNGVFYPLTALFNSNTGVLTCTFSASVDATQVSLSKIQIQIGGSIIFLGPNDIVQPQTKGGSIIEILLSADKIQQLFGTTSDVWVKFNTGAFSQGFGTPTNLQNVYSPTNGLRIFIGDFTYIEGISRPIFANQLQDSNWIIGNSKITTDEPTAPANQNIVQTIVIGTTAHFTVQVPSQPAGVAVRWNVNVPVELQGVVTFSGPNNILTININNPTSAQIRQWNIVVIAAFIDSATALEIGSDQNTVVLNIVSSTPTSVTPSNITSIVEIDMISRTPGLTYDDITFSDFSLGSVFEIDQNSFLVAGLVQSANTFQGATPTNQTIPPDETFTQQAARKLATYQGKVIIIDRASLSVTFEYDPPDGSFASDAVVDGDGLMVIAESNFTDNAGRIVKVDNFSNVVWQISNGLFGKINDVRALRNGNILIST